MAYERRQFSGNAPATTLSSGINNSTTTIPLTSGTGYPDGSIGRFWIVVDRGLATEEKIPCSSRSSNTITAVSRGGDDTTALAHSSGAAVEHVFTATDANEANAHYADTTLDHHAQYSLVAGTRAFTGLTAIAAIAGSSAVGDAASAGTGNTLARANHVHGRESFGTPTGTERPGAANAAGAATTPARSDHAHGMFTCGTATVATSQSTSSTTFGDLATVGPTVTLTTGTSALVILTCAINSGTALEAGLMSFAVSGATTIAVNANNSLEVIMGTGGDGAQLSAAIPVTLTAGSNVFTAKYATGNGNSVSFTNRTLSVIPLN